MKNRGALWLGLTVLCLLTGFSPQGAAFAESPSGYPSQNPVALDSDVLSPAAFGACTLFPADNIWNVPVDTLPLEAHSNAYVATIGAAKSMHADFGSGEWPPGSGSPIGIPYAEVPGSQSRVSVTFDYDDESDPGPYPIPPDAPIEGGPESDGDRHILIVDRDNCILYELFYAFPQEDGSWHAGSGAIFDLKSHALRPETWTSADAAGLPILPGLVRYDEVASGEIRHAIRFTAPQTRRAYVWPARHYASSLTGEQYPPMGQRFRLRAGFDISGFSPQTQVILRALKKYGMILADNGSSWYISGAPDERWNNDVLHELHRVLGSNFEAVDVSSLMIDPDSGQAKTTLPIVSVTASEPLATEGGVKAGRFTVSRTGPTSTAFNVYYRVGGTAMSGEDYQALSGVVKIREGRASAVVDVRPVDDGVKEETESVILTLRTNSRYERGAALKAVVRIRDND